MTMIRCLPAVLPALLLLQACGSEPAPAAGETASPETIAETAAPDETGMPGAEPMASASAEPEGEPEPSASPSPSASPEPTPSGSPSAAAMVAVATPATPPAEFAMCRACHSVEPGKNGIGPSLHGIVGEKAGDVPGYAFSAPLKASGIVWNRATLDEWLTNPMKMVPGTKMVIPVSDPAKRKALIDYLVSLK